MNKEPLVSVIIPMYNAEKYISETLDSLFNQTYVNFEVIIVDNASTDNSVERAEAYRNKLRLNIIKCIYNSGGPATPRNIGIENSKGEYIAFLDSDDLWMPDKLSYQMGLMIKNKHNFTCVSPRAIDINSEVINRSRDISLSTKNKTYGLKSLLFRNSITTSSVIITRELLEEHRFDDSKSVVTCEDYLLWLNLFNKETCSFLHITKKLVFYRVITTSLGNTGGLYIFAAKSLLASSVFLVKNKRQDLMYITIFSNVLRLFKLFILRYK